MLEKSPAIYGYPLNQSREGGEAMKVVKLGDVCPTVQILKHG
jgi:hypothetical protein